jgi:SnoaL-like domain
VSGGNVSGTVQGKTGPDSFVERYLVEMTGKDTDLDRLVTEPSGLDAAGMIAAFSDPRLGRLGIPLMADFMTPEGSIYFDAIFGAYHGQRAIRNWLVPAMAEIEFIEFQPLGESIVFDDGAGGSSLDEWFMVANIGDDKIPLSRGVSVRRYRDGWINWACDVYDTASFRQPPPPGVEAAPLPPWPDVSWSVDPSVHLPTLSPTAHAWLDTRRAPGAVHATTASGLGSRDMLDLLANLTPGPEAILCSSLFHPGDAVVHDPKMGELRGHAEIERWLKNASSSRDALGPWLFNGDAAVQEWVAATPRYDGSSVNIRGTSVRRFASGFIVYAADYYDTAPLS